jgi:hypothetical protein
MTTTFCVGSAGRRGCVLVLGALVLLSGCGAVKDSSVGPAGAAAGQAASGEAEAVAVAKKLLGSDAKVLFRGDLAHNRHTQILAVNPISPDSGDFISGVGFRRAAVLQQNGAMWNEVLLCDEYLKNPDGFLRGTPKQAVTGWNLQAGPVSGNDARELRFTPLGDGGATIHVAWNPRVNRYQSFVANGISADGASGGKIEQGFLEEMPTIETPTSELR